MKWPAWTTRFGPGGAWAAWLLLAAGLLAVGLTPAWQLQAAQAEAAADQAHRAARAERHARLASPPPQASAPSLDLPPAQASRERLAALLGLAQEHQVRVARTEQRLVREQRPQQERWAVSMPAQGRYEDLRRFLEAALQRDPALALEGLRLQREDAGSPLLQAEMSWSLYQQPTLGQGGR